MSQASCTSCVLPFSPVKAVMLGGFFCWFGFSSSSPSIFLISLYGAAASLRSAAGNHLFSGCSNPSQHNSSMSSLSWQGWSCGQQRCACPGCCDSGTGPPGNTCSWGQSQLGLSRMSLRVPRVCVPRNRAAALCLVVYRNV